MLKIYHYFYIAHFGTPESIFVCCGETMLLCALNHAGHVYIEAVSKTAPRRNSKVFK